MTKFLRIVSFVMFILLAALTVQAQALGGVLSANVNVRQSPTPRSGLITTLPSGTAVTVQGRNDRGDWLYIRTVDGNVEGWVAIGFVALDTPVAVMRDIGVYGTGSAPLLPAAVPNAPPTDTEAPTVGIDPSSVLAMDPAGDDVPPEVTEEPYIVFDSVRGNVAAILARGRSLGRDATSFMKVGDSNMSNEWFMCPFGTNSYDLGNYPQLQTVIDRYRAGGSFCRTNTSAQGGFTTATMLDPAFSLPEYCTPNESPLNCEIRRSNAHVAFIYMGKVDTGALTVQEYQANMTAIVRTLSDNGIVPVLATFVTEDIANSTGAPQRFNTVLRQIAAAEQIPFVDVRAATWFYENHGTQFDGYHLSFRQHNWTALSADPQRHSRAWFELQALLLLDDIGRM